MNIPLSIILALLVAFMNAAGFYLQKKGQNKIPGDLTLVRYVIAAVKTPAWLAGIALNLATMPIYIFAISIGHISITQPLANTGIVLLVIIGLKYLKETIGKVEIGGLVLLVSGIFLVALSSPEPLVTYTLVPAEIITFYIIVLALMGGCIVALLLGKKAIGFALLSGLAMGLAASTIKVISVMIKDLGYPSFNVLDIQFDIALLLGIFGGELQLVSFLFYATVGLIVLNLGALMLAFKHGKLTFVTPVQMGTSFILPVIGGFLAFHEPANAALVVGIAICLAGALVLTKVQAALEQSITAAGKAAPAPAP